MRTAVPPITQFGAYVKKAPVYATRFGLLEFQVLLGRFKGNPTQAEIRTCSSLDVGLSSTTGSTVELPAVEKLGNIHGLIQAHQSCQ